MGIDLIKQPEGETPVEEELVLTPPEGEEGDDDAPKAEAIDEIEYPETLDDEPVEETPLIKQLREKAKQDAREKAELRRRLETPRVERTKKPDLWDDCEGDPDKFEEKLLAWKDNERKADDADKAVNAGDGIRERQVQEWQNDLSAYKAKAVKLAKSDFDDAETTVISTLTDAQQSTIVMAAKDPARFIYALGKSPLKLAQLAEITNPIKLAAEVARIEGARMMARKEPANIDEPLKGGARLSSGPTGDEKGAKLLAAAEKDSTKFEAYRQHMREMRAQERAKAA